MPDVAIEAVDIAKRFGDVEALNGVSFEVPTGTVLGLLGPNGAGKTTAVRILTTLLTPDAGRAEVLGIDVRAGARRACARRSGSPASTPRSTRTSRAARTCGSSAGSPTCRPTEIASRTDELLERFDLADAGDRLVRTYSGGMRRRLDLAAALVHRPPVLFLDEPTTGLDPQGRTDLWDVIEELVAGGTTVLLTTQYLEEADRLADRIVVIDHGTVIAEGTAAELKARLGATVIEVGLRDDARSRRTPPRSLAAAIGSVDASTASAGQRDGRRRRDRDARDRPVARRRAASRRSTLALREPTPRRRVPLAHRPHGRGRPTNRPTTPARRRRATRGVRGMTTDGRRPRAAGAARPRSTPGHRRAHDRVAQPRSTSGATRSCSCSPRSSRSSSC